MSKLAPNPTPVQLPSPGPLKGTLKAIGGSMDDGFNSILMNQVVNPLWLAHSDKAAQTEKLLAVAWTMAGAKPANELEGMLIAQMVAAHSAAMECYRPGGVSPHTLAHPPTP